MDISNLWVPNSGFVIHWKGVTQKNSRWIQMERVVSNSGFVTDSNVGSVVWRGGETYWQNYPIFDAMQSGASKANSSRFPSKRSQKAENVLSWWNAVQGPHIIIMGGMNDLYEEVVPCHQRTGLRFNILFSNFDGILLWVLALDREVGLDSLLCNWSYELLGFCWTHKWR